MSFLAIGIAGGTGSGKTTLAQGLSSALNRPHVLISQDAYYHDQSHLEMAQRLEVNYDHPDALELDLLAHHLDELRAARGVEVPKYDFATHSRLPTIVKVDPVPVVLVEGILILAHAPTRQALDLKVYIDTPPELRLARRIRRDVEHRSRVEATVRQQFERTAQPMHSTFVAPSRRHANLVLSGQTPTPELVELVLQQMT